MGNSQLLYPMLSHLQVFRPIFDPRGRPTITADSDQYFRTCCPSVRPSVPTFQNLTKQNNFQARIVIAAGGTVGLAEWIIDDSIRPIFFFILLSVYRSR